MILENSGMMNECTHKGNFLLHIKDGIITAELEPGSEPDVISHEELEMTVEPEQGFAPHPDFLLVEGHDEGIADSEQDLDHQEQEGIAADEPIGPTARKRMKAMQCIMVYSPRVTRARAQSAERRKMAASMAQRKSVVADRTRSKMRQRVEATPIDNKANKLVKKVSKKVDGNRK